MTKHKELWVWVLVNLAALPLTSLAIVYCAVGAAVLITFNGFNPKETLFFLLPIVIVGAICGVLLGLGQGWALRAYGMSVGVWTSATAIGMVLSFALAYLMMLLPVIGNHFAPAISQEFWAGGASLILALIYGCAFAAMQWLAWRKRGYSMVAWLWLGGIAWSILTPLPFIFLWEIANAQPFVLRWAMETLLPVLELLLFSLPYILATTFLLKRQNAAVVMPPPDLIISPTPRRW